MPSPDQIQKELKQRVEAAYVAGQPLCIRGGGTKAFYGREVGPSQMLDVRSYSGIIAYEPTELVITARAGTTIDEIEETLAERGQMLAFEPPHFGEAATLGGTVACGLSGPRRPYVGPLRDFVLGIRCLAGTGKVLHFGGQVMKNVAGYDVSRLFAGALGTLGVLLEVTLKVQPMPKLEVTLQGKAALKEAIQSMNRWAGQPLPLSGSTCDGAYLTVRLSGNGSAVEQALRRLDLERVCESGAYWLAVREQRLAFFADEAPLWRLSVPPACNPLDVPGRWLLDWGGAQRWLTTNAPYETVRAAAREAGGHATLFRGGDRQGEVFDPLAPALARLHRRLKAAFDPRGILNPGRMYRDL
ncbi:MAG: glycolate oxidase subunit GlcE [Gammaproteobacteria bacterium]|nr:glycolate oxidase subunit GlcE [Gammaproteobacteria bacterium]